ncbi:MAG: hypothetical protein V4651_13950 [Bacteroidota bacterium]
MKKLIGLICIPLLFASCSVALFDKVPGIDQKEFPASLQGDYYLKVPGGLFKKNMNKDTLFFTILPKAYVVKDSTDMERKSLDKDNKLSLVNGVYYVIAQRDEEFPLYWKYSFVEPTKKGAKIYFVIGEREHSPLNKYFRSKLVTVKNNGDSVFVYKSDDVQLAKYFEKVLKKTDALEVIRIKK